MILPNLIYVGAEKSGSTSIHRVLSNHNEIFSIRKETEFFSFYNKQIKRDYHINCINKYSKLFSDSNNYKYRMDVSTTYLHHPNAIKNIKRFVKDVKILICLRNPIDRAYSRYWMSAKNNFELTKYSPKKFMEYFRNHQTDISWSNVRDRGFYSKRIKQIYKNFDKKNILVLFYEDLKNNEDNFFKQIYKFLKIKNPGLQKNKKFADSLYSENILLHRLFNLSLKKGLPDNKITRLFKIIYKTLRQRFLKQYPKMGDWEKSELLKFYLDDIEDLEKILKVNLKQWKKL